MARTSPCGSSHATRARAGPTHSAPICACSGWGLPSRRVAATLVVSYTTVSAFPFTRRVSTQVGVFFSAALSVGLPRLAVSQHPALWSPDFPHACAGAQVARPSGPLRARYCSIWRGLRRAGLKSTRGKRPVECEISSVLISHSVLVFQDGSKRGAVDASGGSRTRSGRPVERDAFAHRSEER